MSGSRLDTTGALRAIAFAAADGSSWGAAFGDETTWSLLLGSAGGAALRLEGLTLAEEPDGSWRLSGGSVGADTAELQVVPLAPPPPAAFAGISGDSEASGIVTASESSDASGIATASESSDASDDSGEEGPAAPPAVPPGAEFVPGGDGPELCHLTGTLAGESIDWRAVRMRLAPPRSDREAPGSIRLVAGWLADGAGFGLIAARPRRSERADQDIAHATLFDPEHWLTVAEPRLSTTYRDSGVPSRVNLELWVGEGEQEFARRTAGEASGAPVSASGPAGEATVHATPLRCHSRGADGFGVYLLATL